MTIRLVLVDAPEINELGYNEAIIAAGFAEIYRSFCEVSEFGVSEWAQAYGYAADIDLPNSEGAILRVLQLEVDSNRTHQILLQLQEKYYESRSRES